MENFLKVPNISFSILAISKKDREKFIKLNNKRQYVDYIHIDISDEKNSITLNEVEKFKKICKAPLDLHIAKKYPKNLLKKIRLRKKDNLCVHIENNFNIKEIKKLSKRFNLGLAINLDTPINKIKKFLNHIGYVLFMAAQPGVSGLGFNEKVIIKIKQFKKFKKNHLRIHADGGVNNINSAILREEKVDLIVSGSYLMKSKSIKKQLNLLLGENYFRKISKFSDKKIPRIQFNKKIIDGLKVIDKFKQGIVLVYDRKKIIGLVSDGDIRRYLIKNRSIKENIEKIVNKNYFKLNDLPMINCIKIIRNFKKISAIPIIDDRGNCISIYNNSIL